MNHQQIRVLFKPNSCHRAPIGVCVQSVWAISNARPTNFVVNFDFARTKASFGINSSFIEWNFLSVYRRTHSVREQWKFVKIKPLWWSPHRDYWLCKWYSIFVVFPIMLLPIARPMNTIQKKNIGREQQNWFFFSILRRLNAKQQDEWAAEKRTDTRQQNDKTINVFFFILFCCQLLLLRHCIIFVQIVIQRNLVAASYHFSRLRQWLHSMSIIRSTIIINSLQFYLFFFLQRLSSVVKLCYSADQNFFLSLCLHDGNIVPFPISNYEIFLCTSHRFQVI